VVNPVPVSAQRRQVLAHRSPLEPVPVVRRARLRQRVPQQTPRAIPDALWEELFAAMGCDRDRALLECYVSSGARAGELLGVTLEDIDWAGQLLYVVSKGSSRCQHHRTLSVTWAAIWPPTAVQRQGHLCGGPGGAIPAR
jgi:site-specific recombinase XerC